MVFSSTEDWFNRRLSVAPRVLLIYQFNSHRKPSPLKLKEIAMLGWENDYGLF